MASNRPFPYKTFLWNFGTTSFRRKQLNYLIEKQLLLLDEFWRDNPDKLWGEEVEKEFYNVLSNNRITYGTEKNTAKAARSKTSALADFGLTDDKRKLTEAGHKLLSLSQHPEQDDTTLQISADALLYLQQLLKYTLTTGYGETVRPMAVVLYLLKTLGKLTKAEFTYLAPLCTSQGMTEKIISEIRRLRANETTIEEIIWSVISKKSNYQEAFEHFISTPTVTSELMMAVGMNRKSANYDKAYFQLYAQLQAVYLRKDYAKIREMFRATKALNLNVAWRKLLFQKAQLPKISASPDTALTNSPFSLVKTEEELRTTFFKWLHILKAKDVLQSYFDLNRRYVKLTKTVLFEEDEVKLDIMPEVFFEGKDMVSSALAFSPAQDLGELTPLCVIRPKLQVTEEKMLSGLTTMLGQQVTSSADARAQIEALRYMRFRKLIQQKFTNKVLVKLLEASKLSKEKRDDIFGSLVTLEADGPTIFEYILGIIWYKASNFEGKILDFMKLSLDADLLPLTHAAGGEADIVYEYPRKEQQYPAHTLLLEATLAEETNQRRMEMEPVSRHLGQHLLASWPKADDYAVFVSPFLHQNVISDFKGRKTMPYLATDNPDEEIKVKGMKIIPLDTDALKSIVEKDKKYSELYSVFDDAYRNSDFYQHPLKWYNSEIKETLKK